MQFEKGFQLLSMVCTKMKTLSLISTKNKDLCLFCKTVLNTRVSGAKAVINVMEEAIKFGQMEVFMKAIGKMIKPMAEVD